MKVRCNVSRAPRSYQGNPDVTDVPTGAAQPYDKRGVGRSRALNEPPVPLTQPCLVRPRFPNLSISTVMSVGDGVGVAESDGIIRYKYFFQFNLYPHKIRRIAWKVFQEREFLHEQSKSLLDLLGIFNQDGRGRSLDIFQFLKIIPGRAIVVDRKGDISVLFDLLRLPRIFSGNEIEKIFTVTGRIVHRPYTGQATGVDRGHTHQVGAVNPFFYRLFCAYLPSSLVFSSNEDFVSLKQPLTVQNEGERDLKRVSSGIGGWYPVF